MPAEPAPASAHPIDAPGTGERDWAAWPGLAAAPVLDLAGWREAVIVAAHPDDEVLGAGGIVAMLAARGARLRIVAVTDGEASHHGADESALARRRAAERSAALAALGAAGAEVIRLGLPDGGVATAEGTLKSSLRDLTAGFAACLAPWERDLHADHEAVGRAARRGAGGVLLFYPVWMWHWAVPGDPRVPWGRRMRVPLPAWARAAKERAVGCFESQLEARPGGRGPVLSPEFTAHFSRGSELLFPARRS
jgi:LmbE family N-acetylglucosaminyl deacetylase